MSDHRKFNKKEISEILSKASEIELDEHSEEDFNDGISEEEILQIGKEVGISHKALRRAINQYESKSNESFNWLLGSSELQTSIVINEEVTDIQLDQLFPELNAFTGKKGSLEKVGNSYDWEQNGNEPESIRRITIIPKDGKTKITHFVSWNELRYLGLMLSAMLGSIALMVLLKSIGLPKSTFIPISPLGGIVSYFGFMGGLKYYFNKQKKKFESIMQLITDTLERPAQHRIRMDESPEEQNKGSVHKKRTMS